MPFTHKRTHFWKSQHLKNIRLLRFNLSLSNRGHNTHASYNKYNKTRSLNQAEKGSKSPFFSSILSSSWFGVTGINYHTRNLMKMNEWEIWSPIFLNTSTLLHKIRLLERLWSKLSENTGFMLFISHFIYVGKSYP